VGFDISDYQLLQHLRYTGTRAQRNPVSWNGLQKKNLRETAWEGLNTVREMETDQTVSFFQTKVHRKGHARRWDRLKKVT